MRSKTVKYTQKLNFSFSIFNVFLEFGCLVLYKYPGKVAGYVKESEKAGWNIFLTLPGGLGGVSGLCWEVMPASTWPCLLQSGLPSWPASESPFQQPSIHRNTNFYIWTKVNICFKYFFYSLQSIAPGFWVKEEYWFKIRLRNLKEFKGAMIRWPPCDLKMLYRKIQEIDNLNKTLIF